MGVKLGRSQCGEEHWVKVFENRVLRKIFGPKRDEVTGEWRKLHIEELNDMYSSSNVFGMINSIKMRGTGRLARMGERRSACRGLVGKPEGKRPLRRSRLRWEDKLRWMFRKCDVGVWTGSSWLRIGTGGAHL
jgi:hypothetical protein